MRRVFTVVALLAVVACSGRPVGGASDSTTAAVTTETQATVMAGEGGAMTGSSAATEVGSTSGSTSPLPGPDAGAGPIECDPWLQHCPEGQKCLSHFGDDGWRWLCAEVVPEPAGAGEPCSLVESGVGDTCDVGHMCWDVHPDTGQGNCVPLCIGGPAELDCADPLRTCLVAADFVVLLCVAICDPLAGACDNGNLCVPANLAPDDFHCALDGSGDEGQVFDACWSVHSCDPGLVCVDAGSAAECDPNVDGCCVPFCDLTQANVCPGVGQVCVPWGDPDAAPPGLEHVGVCGLP